MRELNREFLKNKYGTLVKLEKVKKINLDGIKSKIKIQKINCNTFKGLDNLETLHLYNNEITEIKANSFADLLNLKQMNSYYYLVEEIVAKIHSILRLIHVF